MAWVTEGVYEEQPGTVHRGSRDERPVPSTYIRRMSTSRAISTEPTKAVAAATTEPAVTKLSRSTVCTGTGVASWA